MGSKHAFLLCRAFQHSLLQQSFIHHIQFPCAACFVQNQQVGRVSHGSCEVRILQLAGGFLFRFVHLEHEFLPCLAAVHLCTQLFQQRHLAAFAAFEELQDHHPLSAAHGPQSKAHGSGGLALAITVI